MKYLVTHFSIQSSEALFQTARDLLAAGVTQAGFESFVNTPEGIDGYVQEQQYDETEMIDDINALPIKDVKISYQTNPVEDKDWNKDWEDQGFEPIAIDDTVLIYDARHTKNPHPGISSDHIEIGIDAVQAFGTGTHATTRMMISNLLQMDLNGKRVLDCGCGTGILGIAASKMGAKETVGYDIDDWSVRNTKHNAEINGIKNLKILQGDSAVLKKTKGKFDIVLANIHRNIILQDMPAFKSVMKQRGLLAISGFYLSDIPVLLEKAGTLGFEKKQQQNDGEWACLTLQLS